MKYQTSLIAFQCRLEQWAFVELPVAQEPEPVSAGVQPYAVFKCKNGMTLEILSSATPEFLITLIGAIAYAE